MVEKESHIDVRMEVIWSLDLWIWLFLFGIPGAMNDLKILEMSSYVFCVLSGLFFPPSTCYNIAGNEVTWYYTAFIHHGEVLSKNWEIHTSTEKNVLFSKNVEAVRNCIERVSGVLCRSFKMLFIASEFWAVEKMKIISEAAFIINNRNVEECRDRYTSDGSAGGSDMLDTYC